MSSQSLVLRDQRGRIQPGSAPLPGAGRPRRVTEVEYVEILTTTIPPERFQRIVENLALAAEAGNLQAAKMLLGFLIPRVRLEEEGEAETRDQREPFSLAEVRALRLELETDQADGIEIDVGALLAARMGERDLLRAKAAALLAEAEAIPDPFDSTYD